MESVTFEITPGFCPDCGTILPMLDADGGVSCYGCKRTWGPEVFGDMAISYTIPFQNEDVYQKHGEEADEAAAGPIVERLCPKCNHDKMSYATLQLRSADEGQTVFYTCTKCKYKESENS